MSKRITIAEVAESAGVSPTAVSFAFNKPEQLNPETVERIRKIAIELGYVPNPLARALIARRVGVIGVLMPQALNSVLANTYFHTFLQGISSMCDEQALGLLTVSPINGSLDEALMRSPVDGFVIVGFDEAHHQVSPLKKRRVPYVIVDGDATTAASINIDDEGGAHAAATHLLAHGHHDVLVLMLESAFGHDANESHGVGQRRLAGYQRAFREAGWPLRKEWIHPVPSSHDGGARGLSHALDHGFKPTAVLAASDAIAIGAVTAAFRRGLDVPGDLEVIGFDNTSLAEYMRPSISTIHQPIYEKGRMAVEMLVSQIEGGTVLRHVTLPTRLLLRGTTRHQDEVRVNP